MDNGYIKIHRKMIGWEWFTDQKTFSVFIYLLLSANHSDGAWHGNIIKRGQLITGRKSISKATGLTERQVRTALSNLEKTGETTSKTTNRFTIITICNYDKYQYTETKNDQQTANKRPTNDQLTTTNKNVKKEPKPITPKHIKHKNEIKRTVDYFNEKTGKNCRTDTKEYSDKLSALLEKDYTVDDFVRVIDLMFDKWRGDIKMEQYLTIQTLFTAKNFDKYLNSAPLTKTKKTFDIRDHI